MAKATGPESRATARSAEQRSNNRGVRAPRYGGRDICQSEFALSPGFACGGELKALSEPDWLNVLARSDAAATDEFWMRCALLSAMGGSGRANPNPTVGCVIVKDGQLVASGVTEVYGGRHAERCAIDSVVDRGALVGASIYTTLEPCAHWGKQPPCAELVAASGFARCIVGLNDPNPSVAGKGGRLIQSSGTKVTGPVLRNEILAWHLPYLYPHLMHRPLVSVLDSELAAPTRPAEVRETNAWDCGSLSRRYRWWLAKRSDLRVVNASSAELSTLASDGLIESTVCALDLGGHLSNLPHAELRELLAELRALSPNPVLCGPGGSMAAGWRRNCDEAGVPHLSWPETEDPVEWLIGGVRDAGLATIIGHPVDWIVVDHYRELAKRLAEHGRIDTIHVVRPEARREALEGTLPAALGEAPEFSAVADSPIDAGLRLGEYYSESLVRALHATNW